MLTKKQKLTVLAVAVVLLSGLVFASFSSNKDLQGKFPQVFRGSRNAGTEQAQPFQNNYNVRQGRNRDDGPPEPPPPVTQDIFGIGDVEEIPPPSIGNNIGDVENIPPPEVSGSRYAR